MKKNIWNERIILLLIILASIMMLRCIERWVYSQKNDLCDLIFPLELIFLSNTLLDVCSYSFKLLLESCVVEEISITIMIIHGLAFVSSRWWMIFSLYSRRHKLKEDDIAICECMYDGINPESACGETCLNVLTSIECTAGYCPCGEHCRNQVNINYTDTVFVCGIQ